MDILFILHLHFEAMGCLYPPLKTQASRTLGRIQDHDVLSSTIDINTTFGAITKLIILPEALVAIATKYLGPDHIVEARD